MRRNQEPIIMSGDNGDGTKEVVAGGFAPFNVTISQNGIDASNIPAERDKYGFYSFGETLPSNADVRLSR